MYAIEIRIQASEKFSEVLPETLQDAECAVEDIIGCVLLQIFDTINIEEVTIRYLPTEKMTMLSIHSA